MVSAKYLDDYHLTNKPLVDFVGVSLEKLNELEADFLFLIDFSLFITEHLYYET